MFRKIVLIIVINSLIFSSVLLPKTAQAQTMSKVITNWLTDLGIFTSVTKGAAAAANATRAISVPIFDNVQYVQTQIVEPAKAAKETKDNIVQALFTMLFEVLRKRLLDMLVDQIITWIQGGGQPQFVTNWQQFLKDAAGAAIGDVVLETNAAFLCSPFKLQVQLSLLPVPQFSQRVECTLDDIVKNIEDFYNDFEKGGWIAYNEAWQPQGNYYGEMLMIHDEMLMRGALAKEAAQNEALAGKGFLSVKRCKAGGSSTGERDQMEIDAPGSTNSFVKDYKGNWCPPEQIENITPGAVVGDMASKAVGTDIDYILSARELEQYVTAIVNAVINRVIKEGVGLIKGSSEYKYDSSAYTQPYEDALTDIQRQEKQNIMAEYQRVLDDRNAVLANKKQSLSNTQQLVVVLKKIKTANCQPAVTDADISSAEAEVNRLKTEIADLEKLINEIQALKTEAEKISADYRLREMSVLTQKYNEFQTKYSSVIVEVYSGSAKAASQQEAQTKQTELSNAQARLITCGINP